MTYAVLLSHSSETTRPGLVEPERFDRATDASSAGHRAAKAVGVAYTVVRETADGWVTRWGKTPSEALRDFFADQHRWWR